MSRISALARRFAFAALLACTVSGAEAQWDSRSLPAGEIVAVLRQRGFVDVSRPRRDGTTYRVEVTNRRGQRLSLVLDAYDAEILERGPADRDDAILPPRDVGPAARRLDPAPLDRGYSDTLPPLDDEPALDEEQPLEEGRVDLDQLPRAPAPVYREELPAPEAPAVTVAPPASPGRVEELRRQEAERGQPPVRRDPLALPPSSGAPAQPAPAVSPTAPSRPAPAPAPQRPATAAEKPKQAEAAAAPKPAQPADQKDAPRPKVRIIGGVTPVIPRDATDATKPN